MNIQIITIMIFVLFYLTGSNNSAGIERAIQHQWRIANTSASYTSGSSAFIQTSSDQLNGNPDTELGERTTISGTFFMYLPVVSKISNKGVEVFLNKCPNNDPDYSQLRQDFDIRIDGQVITTTVSCTEPFSAIPAEQLTDELISVQTFRLALYMNSETTGKLPWTEKGIYDWMHAQIGGINLISAPNAYYCCDIFNGKKYIVTSLQDNFQHDHKRDWKGLSSNLEFYAHEVRHTDPGTPSHVSGCAEFPPPSTVAGCDQSYDSSNFGAFGVEYWLNANWATGYVNVGISCSSVQTSEEYVLQSARNANDLRLRFIENVPPEIVPTKPYGGECK